MATPRRPSFHDLFRTEPVRSTLLAVGPIALAVGQLVNGYVNGLSPIVTLAFALVMIAFAAVATGHHAAQYRRRRLEADLER
ncbi:hypothetical protein [Natronococcus occultus]|uniref:Uncharacterized protein n=1 Tax=Natronococcus occultus SP4 TaxID=694430 RepID=L0K313_9EURY|nr:hypothetical protein [Natronococcus occultus]AGB38498.1 hypothetical protein Natoc_2739 [Natronococcus occultus SP4]